MAFLVNFTGGHGTFPSWSTGTGDFTISGRSSWAAADTTNLFIGQQGASDNWAGILGGTFRIKLGTSTPTDTGITVPADTAFDWSLERVGADVTVTVSGTTFLRTNRPDNYQFDISGGNSSSIGREGEFYTLTLTNGTDDRVYDANTTGGTGTTIANSLGANPMTLVAPFTFETFTPSGNVSALAVTSAPFSLFVYQRKANGFATVTRTVTWVGEPSTADTLQYRLYNADTSAVVQDWTQFDATPSGGTSTLEIEVAGSLTPLNIQVRTSDTAVQSPIETVDWLVGDRVLVAGQSLAGFMCSAGTNPNTPGIILFNGTAGSLGNVGNGVFELARGSVIGEQVPCMIIRATLGGSPMTLTGDAGGTNWWASKNSVLFTDLLSTVDTATGGDNKVSYMYWHQGTEDGKQGVSSDEYAGLNFFGGMSSLIQNTREIISGPNGERLSVFAATLGRFNLSGSTDAQHQNVRNAILRVNNSDNFITSVNFYNKETVDGVHGSEAAYTEFGKEIAALNLSRKGLVSISSPECVGAILSTNGLQLDLVFNQALNAADTTYSLEGLRVEVNGTPATVTGFARNGTNKATITLSTAITTGQSVRVILGYGEGTSNNQLVYPRSLGVTLPNTLGTVSVVADCFNAELFEA